MLDCIGRGTPVPLSIRDVFGQSLYDSIEPPSACNGLTSTHISLFYLAAPIHPPSATPSPDAPEQVADLSATMTMTMY